MYVCLHPNNINLLRLLVWVTYYIHSSTQSPACTFMLNKVNKVLIWSEYLITVLTSLPEHLWIRYIPRNMHTVFALLCFVVVIHWLIFTYPSGLLHWHCGNLTIAPVPAKQPWWIWINTSCEFIMNDCVTTTKQSTTKPCAYFLGYTVNLHFECPVSQLKSQMVCLSVNHINMLLLFLTTHLK